MKRIAIVVTILAIVSCGHKRGTSNAVSSSVPDREPGWSVLASEETSETATSTEEEGPDIVPISHRWIEIDPAAYIGKAPTAGEIAKWEREFEKANDADSVWVVELNRHKSPEQLMCVTDLIELLHGPMCEDFKKNDMRIQWRLLQYAGEETTPERSELEKVLHLREVSEDMLDYELGSQWDMNMYSWLVNDMQDVYLRLMYDVASKHLPAATASALKAEQKAALKAHLATSAAYQKIDGTPDGFNGSSYPYRVAMFGSIAEEMEIKALEPFFCSILKDSLYKSEEFVSMEESKALVEKEYKTMERSFEADDYSFPVKDRVDAMENDRAGWNAWMVQRERVSALLSGYQKDTYDRATIGMYRHKLIMLKNRYESGSFVPQYYEKILLPYEGVTTEEILAHNFEKLYQQAIND